MVTLRALLPDDIPAHVALLAAAEAVDDTGEHYNEADLVEEYENPDVEIGRDIVGAFDGDDLVGYFSVYPRAADGSHLKAHLEGTVRPDRRGEGIGTELVTAMVARADAIHAERHPDLPAHLAVTGLSSNAAQESLLAGSGLLPHRWNFTMRAFLDRLDDTAPPPLPPGLTLLTYAPDLDAATREAHNEAFLDHPDFTPWTEVMWRQWVSASRNFRPALSVVVVEDAAPERVVAYVVTNEYDAYFEATGQREAYVAKVGTRRGWRGRGVASTLLRESLRRYRAAGLDEASLDVDAENPTGALGVYERAGFEVERRSTNYVLDRPPLNA